jgi:pyoluteorin transport system ATP-binding protein
MSAAGLQAPALFSRELRKSFRRSTGEVVHALEGISVEIGRGELAAFVGPDGAGKTTFLRLATGLLAADGGQLIVLGTDVAANPQYVQSSIGYMPQRFGLYEDLTVQENLNLYADLHGVNLEHRGERFAQLMQMTALEKFRDRLAGRLSGGMKQKLGLACTLVRSPELLLLDEPTVGVDPLSRRELWAIIEQLLEERRLAVVVSTSYLNEADRCAKAVVLHDGKVLTQGPPADVSKLAAGRTFRARPPAELKTRLLQARLLEDPGIIDAVPEGGYVRFIAASHEAGRDAAGRVASYGETIPATARFEDGFMVLLRQHAASLPERTAGKFFERTPATHGGAAVVQVRDLVRKFGSFTAVEGITFDVHRGEIFGLLGPNGAGKTTTFRMLCGLLPPTSGTLQVAGVDLSRARASARQRIGYVAQKFSLYGQLTVAENLEFFASAYGLRRDRKRQRIERALEQFELASLARQPSGQLPAGQQRRLAMAAALLHEPEILFLDEPTSGADPLARREFWWRITALAEQGVTVIVTTHFMEEAEYCDRIIIMDAGRVLAQGTPADVRGHARTTDERDPTMEDAFIAIVDEAREVKSK